ncbi:MAG: 50S ribosomal protein L11 methyltransferase [Oscillospiraceae bacterium]|nr:50S ribosomal protein L11 methyltransferase [Oscillospiraceae bacterium]
MEWFCVKVDTCPDGIDLLAGQLAAMGYDSLVIENEAEIEEFADQNEQYWGEADEFFMNSMDDACRVVIYMEKDEEAQAKINKLMMDVEEIRNNFALFPLGSLEIHCDEVNDSEWQSKWEEYYKPTPVGERFMILPLWDAEADTEGRLGLVLDPGVTFGTGRHATTAMCLELLENMVKGGEKVLDLGCGSGVLSIGALHLGAKTALGVDIDPLAVSVSVKNAEANAMGSDRYSSMEGDVCAGGEFFESLRQEKFDLILANIVADVLITMAPWVAKLMAENTKLICSGIIEEKAESVKAAFVKEGLKAENSLTSDGWCSFVFAK